MATGYIKQKQYHDIFEDIRYLKSNLYIPQISVQRIRHHPEFVNDRKRIYNQMQKNPPRSSTYNRNFSLSLLLFFSIDFLSKSHICRQQKKKVPQRTIAPQDMFQKFVRL